MARKMIDFSKLNPDELKEFKMKYDAYIFDFDETLIHLNGTPIEGVEEALNEIAKKGKSIMVLTDNCLLPLIEIAEKVNRIFPVIKKENVMSAGYLVVRYLKEINFKKKVYVIGSQSGIISELKDCGFDVLHDQELKNVTIPELRKIKFEDNVGAVVMASDPNFNYLKMFKATNYLADPQVLLMQTHIPKVAARNPILPAVGAMISSVLVASGRKETIATGKGSEYCSKYLKSLGFQVERCLFVGDGISNDILAGNVTGMDTLLVLTGASTLGCVQTADRNLKDQIPTYYAKSVADLIKVFEIEES